MAVRVLLFRIDPRDPEGMRMDLESLGYLVETASLDSDLVELVEAFAPDLLIGQLGTPHPALLVDLHRLELRCPLPVLIFTRHDDVATLRRFVEAGVSAYVVGDVLVDRLESIIEVARARFAQTQGLKKELASTRSRLKRRVVVDRVKGLLMDRHGLTEDQAYQRLRKAAMDRGCSVDAVAQGILDSVDLLG